MKTSYVIGLIVLVVVVIGGIAYAMHAKAPTSPAPSDMSTTTMTSDMSGMDMSGSSSTNAAPATVTQTVTTKTTTTATPAAQHFTVNGNDSTADVKTISVAAGTPVSITFGADAGTTYHGGLDYRSSVVNTGTIAPGSTKTITFTADHSFSFTPYWPATNIAKPYTIDIVVH